MTHKLIFFGDPRFRQRAEPVEEITPEIGELVHDIVAAMDEHGAIGLSAVHVGVMLRIVVIR